jgi:hypothetical protein
MNGNEIRRGEKYRVLPEARRWSGNRVPVEVHGRTVEADRDGLDRDGDATMIDDRIGMFWILPEYLEPVGAPVATAQGNRIPNPAGGTVSATAAFRKDGNEIEFTVVGTLSGDTVSVGCKTAPLAKVLPFLQKLDRSVVDGDNRAEFTLRAVVKDGKVGTDDVWIDRYDLDSYGKDIRIISFLEEVKPDVTVTLTHAQAEAIGAIGGRISGRPEGLRGNACEGIARINQAIGYDSYLVNPARDAVTSTGSGIRFND